MRSVRRQALIAVMSLVVPLGVVIASPPAQAACTGSTAASGNATVVTFTGTASCTWTIPAGVTSIDAIVVGAGGGGGGGSGTQAGAGGGAGAVTTLSSLAVTPGSVLTITQGVGGSGGSSSGGSGSAGTSSSLVVGATTYTAAGGSGGISRTFSAGATGGGSSGNGNLGGAAATTTISGVSYNNAAGGGGAGAAGSGRSGGSGVSSSITGTALNYGVGGGGGSYRTSAGTADAQGPPNSGYYSSAYGQLCSYAGVRGGGGGGAMIAIGGVPCSGSSGSNGLVILRYTVSPKFSLTITASPTTYSLVGDVISYTMTATNTGGVTATGTNITDPDQTGILCTPTAPASVAVNGTITCTGQHTVTAADISAGSILSTATVSGTGNGVTATATASATVTKAALTAAIAVTKTADPSSFTSVGTQITYTVQVQNTGAQSVTSLSVVDPLVPGLACDGSTLAVGAHLTCSGTYTTTQADVDAGSVQNTATASGTAADSSLVTATGTATVTGPAASGAMTVVKSASPATFSKAGQTLTYTVTATNTGNVTLSTVAVTDPLIPSLMCSPSTIAPGQAVTCTGTYTVTDSDMTAGSILNSATATAQTPGGAPVQVDGSLATSIGGRLTLSKLAAPTTYSQSGVSIAYTLIAVNNGAGPVTSVVVSDPNLPSLTCLPVAGSTLEAGQRMTCQGIYTTTSGDLASGSVTNTATVSGTASSVSISATADAIINRVAADPQISLTKSASPLSVSALGQIVSYTLTATNIGNVVLSDVTITDPLLSSLDCTPSAPSVLAPGAVMTCGGQYAITQADIDAGGVSNTARASGMAPDGAITPTQSESTIRVTGPTRVPGVALSKSSSPASFTKAGQRVTFQLVATNTGNVTLNGMAISDPMLPSLNCAPASGTPIAPGLSMTCLGVHTVTQAEVDSGSISNSASVQATGADGTPVSDSTSMTAAGPVAAPSLSLAKTASPTTFSAVGQTITYTLIATNAGNVTLSGVTIADSMLNSLSCAPVAPAVLAPGSALTCRGTHVVTQTEVDSGSLSNSASASGLAPGGAPVSASVGPLVTAGVAPVSQLSVTKSASPAIFAAEGDTLSYTIDVRNTGATTIRGVVVSDPAIPGLNCTGGPDLGPGDSMSCVGDYVVTALDAARGYVDNSVTASGTASASAGGGTTLGSSGIRVRGPVPRPDLTVTKSSSPVTYDTVGQVVTYTVAVVNTGNVPLSGLVVEDPNAQGFTCTPTSTLDIGDQVICTGTHTITQRDIDSGTVVNVATASAQDLLGRSVFGRASVDVFGPAPSAAVTVTKSASPLRVIGTPGRAIPYTVTVTNAGNVTLSALSVSDPLISEGLVCDVRRIAPGDTALCTGTHYLTAAEARRVQLLNVASVVTIPARGTAPPGSAQVSVTIVHRDPPVTVSADDVARWTWVDTAVDGSLSAHVRAPAGSTFTTATRPGHGSVQIGARGTYVYRPASRFVGVDSFRYQVCAPAPNASICAAARVVVNVKAQRPAHDPPIAKPVVAGGTSPVAFQPRSAHRAASLEIAGLVRSRWESTIVVPGQGRWQISGDRVYFVPNPHFLGRTTIRYRVVDVLGNVTYGRFTAISRATPCDFDPTCMK